MKLLKPQVQLIRKRLKGKPDEYFLHAITIFGEAGYQANGYHLAKQLNANDIYEVTLLVKKDNRLPKLSYLTPVVHTIDLGNLPFGDEEGLIKVSVKIDAKDILIKTRGGNVGSATTGTSSADEMGKPILTAS